MRYLIGFMACVILGGCVVLIGSDHATVDQKTDTATDLTPPETPAPARTRRAP